MSIDGFAAFQEIGMSATAAIAEEGLHYRDTILSLGGARAPGLVFQVCIILQCVATFTQPYCVRQHLQVTRIAEVILLHVQDFRGRPPMTLPLLKDEGLVTPNTTASAESGKVFMMD